MKLGSAKRNGHRHAMLQMRSSLSGGPYEDDDYDEHDIDERYDDERDELAGDGDYDSGPDDYYGQDGYTSPRAPKPKPLDQSFVPKAGQKYFSVTIGYPAMRAALRARGFIEVKCYKRI